MKRTMFFAAGLVLAGLAMTPALAQTRGSGIAVRPHALAPGMSVTSPATTPLQAQMQDDYAGQLRAEQRDMLQANPSGLTPQERAVGHALNGFTPQ